MRLKTYLSALLFALCTLTACGDDDEPVVLQPENPAGQNDPATGEEDTPAPADSTTTTPDTPTTPVAETKYVGGDISMLTKYEEQQAQYLDKDGKATGDLLTFLRQQGWNTMRVRLFVDPSKDTDKAVCQDLDYVKALCRRIKQAGLLLMLDFHYSDTWADPGSQWTPDAWKTLSNDQLYAQIYDYTRDCLQQLVAAGATPDLIQTGNEISYGMMWGTKAATQNTQTNRCYTNSPAANWTRFTTLLKQAGKACREVCPQARIIVHSERAPKPDVLTDFFDRMKQAQVDYDVIGLSYYPYFHGQPAVLDAALKRLEAKNYGKPIQIVETGFPSQYEVPGTSIDYYKQGQFAYSAEAQRQFTADLIDLLQKHPLVEGISWWYAEANAKGCTGDLSRGWYNAGLFDNNTGRALPALYELQNFR